MKTPRGLLGKQHSEELSMMQTQHAWKALDGADCVSSEDESWLNHPGFHLSDSDEDELQSVGMQYVHAVMSIKGPATQAAAEGDVTAVSARQQDLPTTRALEMLLPQELPYAELSKNANPADMQSASLANAQTPAAAARRSIPTSTSSPVVPSKSSAAAPSTSPQQQLPSPASKVATKPFSGLPPPALAQQQNQQLQAQQQARSQQHLAGVAVTAAATTAGLLELSLSAEQIALLQAAADNAQSYLDRDAAAGGASAEQTHVTTPGSAVVSGSALTAPQHDPDWDMQSAIVEAFKYIMPAATCAPATASTDASASARNAVLQKGTNPVLPAPADPNLQGSQIQTLSPLIGPVAVQHRASITSQDHPAEQGIPMRQGTPSLLQPATTQNAGEATASPASRAILLHGRPGVPPINKAPPTALAANQAIPDVDPQATEPRRTAPSQQPPHAPHVPAHGPSQATSSLQPEPAARPLDAAETSGVKAPAKQAPIPASLHAGLSPASMPAAAPAEAASVSVVSTTAAAAKTAATPTAAAPRSTAAEPLAAAAVSGQALAGTASRQLTTASSPNTCVSSQAATTQPASVDGGSTAVGSVPTPVSAIPKTGGSTLALPSALPHALTASVAGLGQADLLGVPTKLPHAPPPTSQAAPLRTAEGSSAPLGGESRGLAPMLSADTAASPAVTPAATAAIPAATPAAVAAPPPVTAATPAATAAPATAPAATPAVTAAIPPATAPAASSVAASQSTTGKPSAVVSVAPRGSLGASPGGITAGPAAAGTAAEQSTAKTIVKGVQGLSALAPPGVQTSQMASTLTAAPRFSTPAALPPLAPSMDAVPAGSMALSPPSWTLAGHHLSASLPQLPVNLTPTESSTPRPPTTAGVSPELSFGPPDPELVARLALEMAASSSVQLLRNPSSVSAAAASQSIAFGKAPTSPAPPAAQASPGIPARHAAARASQGFAGIPSSPSLFSPAHPAAPAKNKASKAGKKRKASQQPTPAPKAPKSAKKLPASAASGAKKLPASSAASGQGTSSHTSADPLDIPSPDPNRHQPDPHRDPVEFDSPELRAMRKTHGGFATPMVGAYAVQPQLAAVKSLVVKHLHRFNLREIVVAIGQFAIGQEKDLDIFLGDQHNSEHHHYQISSVANLFGVTAQQSPHADRFHETWYLTRLVKTANAGILTMHGDLLIYYILELSDLCKQHQSQLQEMYRREEQATLNLANAVGRKLKGSGRPSDLTKGALHRLQQLSKLGYLAVKRSKEDRQQNNIKPPRYPGWQGRPRYGPVTSRPVMPKLAPPPLPLPPQPQPVGTPPASKLPANTPAAVPHQAAIQPSPTHQLLLPARTPAAAKTTAVPQKVSTQPSLLPTSTPAELRDTFPPTSAPTPLSSLPLTPGLQSQTASSAAILTQATAAAQLPLLSQAPATAAPTPTPQSASAAVAPVLALSSPSAVQVATATVPTRLTEPSGAHRPQQLVLSDATAALVAAVGPLFESFVAQTAAVVADPGVSLQTLAGSLTQNLAAAIASAAVQVVAQRRQQERTPTAGHSSADIALSQAPGTDALGKSPVLAGGLVPVVVAPTQAVHVPSRSGLSHPVGAHQPATSVAVVESKQGPKYTGGVSGTGTKSAATQGAGLSNASGSIEAHRKRVAASSEGVLTSNDDRNQRQAGGIAKDLESSRAKRQKTGVATLKAAPLKNASRSDTSGSDRAQTGSISTQSTGNKSNSHKGTGRGSPASQGSGKSSPKEYGSFDGASHSHRVASPVLMGRNSPGTSFQYPAAPALLPSKLSDSFGPASPMMSVPMPYAPGHVGFPPSNVYGDMMSSPQADLAAGCMPVLPPSPGNWHMHAPALNNFPMAAHFLPGIAEAPDFSPVE